MTTTSPAAASRAPRRPARCGLRARPTSSRTATCCCSASTCRADRVRKESAGEGCGQLDLYPLLTCLCDTQGLPRLSEAIVGSLLARCRIGCQIALLGVVGIVGVL